MNGNFEYGKGAYPVGYLRVGLLYQVTNMVTLQPIDERGIRQSDAVRIAADMNARIRDHVLTLHGPRIKEVVSTWIDGIAPGHVPEGAVV